MIFDQAIRELQILNIAIDCIDNVINKVCFSLIGPNEASEVMFPSNVHQQYFYINVLDFLSDTSKEITGSQQTLLKQLRNVGEESVFKNAKLGQRLQVECTKFMTWLDTKIELKYINASSINRTFDLSLTRLEIFKICGNKSKHNLSRLNKIADLIKKICYRSEINLSLDECLIFMPQLYEQLHDDILNYHASTVAEMLNSIRWSIHGFLLQEFNRSYTKTKSDYYTYKIPVEVSSEYGKNLYWQLMNHVRSEPIFPRFTASQYLKGRY